MPPLLPGVPTAPLSAEPSAPVVPAGPPGRAIDDPAVVRRAIFDNALSTVQSLPPITSSTHTLRFANAGYEGPENVGMRAYKQALLTGDTLARRLRADVELVDNASGTVLDSRRTTLAAVPYYTDAGVFVNRGTKYAMANQQRLRPGAYTRERDNGEVETHFNVPPGQGMPFRVFLDPASGVFKARVGQAQIPLVPLLQSLGVTEPELQTAWGARLATANVAKVRGGDTQKLYARLVRNGKSQTEPEQMAEMRQLLENTKLDPDVMRHTLGSPFERVDATALLTATRKLLAIHNRKDPEMLKQLGLEPAEQDDRDHLAFMRLMGPEDIIAERLRTAPKVLRPLLWKAGRTGKLEHVGAGVLTRLVQDAILGSGLGQATEDINPLQVFEQQLRVTRMGVGGIPSADSIPDSSRSVQPSHAGYIDPIVTPECFDDQTEVMTRRGWVPWPQVTALDEFAVQIDGQLDWRLADALHAGPYAGQMVVVDTDILNFCVTPNHRLWTRPDQAGDSKYRFEEARYSYRRARKFACAGHQAAAGAPQTVYHVPPVARGANNQVVLPPLPLDDWAEFLGWFLSEGCTQVCLKPKLRHYVVRISQSRAANPQLYADLLALCARLPFSVCSNAKGITVSGKQLTLYCQQFGLCYDKFIPSEAFDWPAAARRRLLIGLLKGDGRKGQFDVEKLVGLQYCTTSPRLAADVERLVFSLGFSSRTVIEPENREAHYHDNHVVHIHSRWERTAQNRALWRLEPYAGTVYCATVPGGLLYVRRNGKVGHWSGNSANAGIDVRLSRLARKGPDGELYSKFTDMRTGETLWKQPKELFDSVIAFSTARLPSPGRPFDVASYAKLKNALDRGEIVQSKSGRYFTQGIQRGQLDYYPMESVDYAIPHMENAFSPTANLVPGKSGMKGQRVAMGARMQTQALPLVDAEAPLVQSGLPGESGSFEALYGARMGAVRAPQGGRVLSVNPDSVVVQYDDGQKAEIELAQHVPGARKTYLQQDAVVAAGDVFQSGQLLARSNYTDKDGTAALGKNLRTAWMSLKGHNYEDAVVLSESGAKKLTSQHMYKTAVDIDKDGDRIGLATYRGMFPKRFTKEQLDKVDEHGVVRVGQRVESGDPLVLVASERKGRVGEVSRAGSSRFRDSAETWEHDHPGVVTDVAKTKNGVVVAVKSISPMQVGDKLSNRFGSKGVVAAILPDDEMPQDENGQPIELALNELGITTRTNPIQAIEAILGKVAQKRGQPYHLPDFDQITDLRAYAQREAAQHGVKDREELLDPETGNKIPGIITGPHFVMKLHHVAESKVSGRSFGAYTADGTPSKGGPEGAKTWGMLHLNALLSHGAVQVAKDGHAVRGQRNPQYWAAVMAGKAPPDPEVPPVYRKFVAQLQAAGIHPVREGTRTHLMAMTNAGIKELAGDREVTSPDTVDWNDDGMKPITGGLFDERLFGGVNGCFHPSVTVWTERGPLPIGQIVQQRLAVRVQTYNFQTQRFELKPITNWFQNCSREGIGRAVFADGVAGRLAGRHARYNPTTLWGTRGHQVYDGDGQKHDLAAATQLTFAVESLSYTQEQLIYGTLLGDGHVRPDGLYDASHGMRQAGYLRLKYAILRPLCDNPPVEFLDTSGGLSRRKIRFLTKAHDALRQARNLCYVGQRKTLSAEWLAKVDEMGLAFWFFDDGSVHRNRGKNTVYVKFCTECFSSVEVHLLQRWLAARWGLSDSYLARDDGRYENRDCGWQICLAGDNAWQLLTLVAPYAEQSVRYKFPVRPRMARCACGSEIAPAATYCNRCLLTAAAACGPGKLPRTVRDRFGDSAAVRTLLNTGTVPPTTLPLVAWQAVRDVLGRAVAKMQTDTELRLSLREEPVRFLWQTGARWERTRTVYDIEVADNHNYFANGVLVSNSRWAKITLPEPLPSPVMEEPIRRVLGLTGPQFERVLGGQEQLNGETGSAAIAKALDRVDVDAEIERATREIRGTRKTARDAATRRVGFLLGARKTGIHPRDWMWDSVPVMPPRWRPVNRMQGTGSPMVADANYLYRDLFENKQNFEQLRDQVSDVGDERLALYQSLRAVTGLGDPAPEHLREQQIKGALQHIIGSSPKFGVVQRRLLGSQTDLVGRGTIVPNPDLDMDQVGLPEEQAWQVYRPFLVRHMAKRGVAPGRAAEMVAAKTDVARRALTEVMSERPVLLDRAPVLHRYGVMAFWPRIAKGNQIELTPIVTKGFGADFDGDAMQFHVPGSDKAVTDAVEKMLPSANLRAPSNFKVHQLPQQEYLAGLYRATRDRKNVEPVRFPTTKAMLAALSRGTISHDQPVIIEADEES